MMTNMLKTLTYLTLFTGGALGTSPANKRMEQTKKLFDGNGKFFKLVAQCSSVNAQWLRAAFHDAGTYEENEDKCFRGGLNGSLRKEKNRPENAGLEETVGVYEGFSKALNVPFADVVVAGAVLAVKACGGPEVQPTWGRIDTKKPDMTGKLPPGTASAKDVGEFAKSLKFESVCERVAVINGAHTLGGIHRKNNPGLFPRWGQQGRFISFDTTPEKFDNDIFKQIWTGNTPLESDKELMKHQATKDCVEMFKKDEKKFFEVFARGMEKLLSLGTCPDKLQDLDVEFPRTRITNPYGL